MPHCANDSHLNNGAHERVSVVLKPFRGAKFFAASGAVVAGREVAASCKQLRQPVER